ncbi:MAG: hypothetical protein E6705_07485 [Peptoniphilus harei]|nr:hypothetical protein [Peptoniphilus harei]MDU3087734.1 hypothetical protein [Peptoniphilus harei]
MLQIEVPFGPSLCQMVAADLPAICFTNWVRSSMSAIDLKNFEVN